MAELAQDHWEGQWQNMAILGLEPNIVHWTWYKQEGKRVKVVQTGHPTGLLVKKGNIGVTPYTE